MNGKMDREIDRCIFGYTNRKLRWMMDGWTEQMGEYMDSASLSLSSFNRKAPTDHPINARPWTGGTDR